MWTVKEVSEKTGVSVRALHHYDAVGLLAPAAVTNAGYRLYDEKSLERLGEILLFRELEFSLKEIRAILDDPAFDRRAALEKQIELLTLRRVRLEKIISAAEKMKNKGGDPMDPKVFDKENLTRYAEEAKKTWGGTEAYREYEEKSANRKADEEKALAGEMMQLFAEFGARKAASPASEAAQAQVKRLQDFITKNYYTCTKEILSSLGEMYVSGGEMTENIDAAGGEGTAAFAAEAIRVFCR